MNKKILLALTPALLLTLAGCQAKPNLPAASSSASASTDNGNNSGPTTSETKKDVTLRLSVHYQDEKTRMKFGTTYSSYTDPKGTTYKTGDFKPAWKALQERLEFKIDDKTPESAKKVNESYTEWSTAKFKGVDILCGSASSIVNDSVTGDYFVNLLDYTDKLPNFTKFLEDNPIVATTITSAKYNENMKDAIYYAPYFDGFDDLERMTLLRQDWVEALLDSEDTQYDEATVLTTKYVPQTTGAQRAVEVPKADGSGKETITRATTTNVIQLQNELPTKNGKTLVQALKDYIKTAYGNQFSKPSELFTSERAVYDADEFVALLRCVKANPQLLTGTNNVVPFFPRANTNDRIADIYRWAGNLWGIRGLESRSGFLYVGKDNKIHDARGDEATAKMLTNLNAIYSEGLILQDFDDKDKATSSSSGSYDKDVLKAGIGFASYDYCQTQAAHNTTVEKEGKNESFKYVPVLGAVCNYDNGDSKWEHFTESWRSVKTEGWAITADCASDPDKLDKALEVFDYFYSKEGNQLMSYGPKEYGYLDLNADGTVKTIDYNGKQVPKLSQATLDQLANIEIGNANYTNYYRYFVGSTYPVGYVKEQGMEYQCTADEGKEGLNKYAALTKQGLLKHPTVDNIVQENRNGFYDLVPTTFRVSKGDSENITTKFGGLDSINYTKSKTNEWTYYVINGYGAKINDSKTLFANEEDWINNVKTADTWKVTEYENIYANALKLMLGE